MNNNLLNFLLMDEQMQRINMNIVGEIVNDLAQPLYDDDEDERGMVPKNKNFYEVTIPSYMGDLFKEHFRMSRTAFQTLLQVIGRIEDSIQHKIPLEKKLLFMIWVISKPESFLAAGDRFGMARSTAHTVFVQLVANVCCLLHVYINWPVNFNTIEQGFRAINGLPGTVGAIDGCHVEIKQPNHNANDYFNRNSYHSIILQGTCDHKMMFIDVFVGVPGRVHDARVFKNSPVYNEIHNLPQNVHILGDSAYPLSLNVLTPFRDNGHLNNVQNNFNIKHSSTRAVIERAFGRLKGKFRRLKYLDIFNPDFGCEIITAACVLHNFIILEDSEEVEEFQPDEGILDEYDGVHQIHRNLAVEKRNNIAEQLMLGI